MKRILSILIYLMISCPVLLHAQSKSGDDEAQDDLQVFIPNAFTPNGDRFNEFWKPVISGAELAFYELQVVDRHGQEVFYTKDPNLAWNGQIRGSGYSTSTSMYLYYLRVRPVGKPDNREYRGYIVLIR